MTHFDAYIIDDKNMRFAAYTAAQTPNDVRWAGQLPRCPFPFHLIHDSLGPPESVTKTASRSIQPFLHNSPVWPTQKQTDRPLYVRHL